MRRDIDSIEAAERLLEAWGGFEGTFVVRTCEDEQAHDDGRHTRENIAMSRVGRADDNSRLMLHRRIELLANGSFRMHSSRSVSPEFARLEELVAFNQTNYMTDGTKLLRRKPHRAPDLGK